VERERTQGFHLADLVAEHLESIVQTLWREIAGFASGSPIRRKLPGDRRSLCCQVVRVRGIACSTFEPHADPPFVARVTFRPMIVVTVQVDVGVLSRADSQVTYRLAGRQRRSR
jgi:hypothetical protein